ncbi:MAG TPA: Hsp70 family protein, partial [Candidatus Rifleibacterium sp.]|nr:Hsp70 family protein [Candidatus Rifleibacterium sp.]
MAKAKYIVGIDLGTTNIVLSYAPLAAVDGEEPAQITLLPIVQELAKGAIEKLEVLPSFIFERLKEKPVLTWEDDSQYIVGDYARERGAEVPDRLISSAKSWLCNPRIDRTQPVLPWNSPEENAKISPLAAMAIFLRHVRHAWAEEFAKEKLEDQKVVVTIPASFDAAARDMIVEAARMAGLPTITLLEEPQAAFYSWISQSDKPWRQQVKKGDVVLVVDVGGGTSDFSLIEISEAGGDLSLERVAVGNHILLGGDNMDLALAYVARRKLEESSKKISQWQTVQLSHQCRKAKEILLSDPSKDSVPIVISGRGSSVIGGSMKTTIERG